MSGSPQHVANGFLYTDQYELTMAQLYFRAGLHETEARFEHFFRRYPDYGTHQAGYCISAGLGPLLDWMQATRIQDEELARLRGLTGRSGDRVFADDFLDWLRDHGHYGALRVEAVPEGRTVHANVPLTVVHGPLAAAQILESALLNKVNYQTLIATKAARMRQSGGGVMIDFGMRRAPAGAANDAARAALIGGADFSSNTGMSLALGYPPKGTQAHSMVQAFMALGADEEEAFRQYAEVYPDDCLLLVDTVDTLGSGMPKAIRVFEELKRRGHRPLGVRLDSGDLAYLAVQAAKMLNAAGFDDCTIVLSNQLDELVIRQIIDQVRREAGREGMDADAVIGRLSYGIGTRLVTSAGDGALDGVYKLVGLRRDGEWHPSVKVSENPAKTLNPGIKQACRLYDERGMATADYLCLADERPEDEQTLTLRHPIRVEARRQVPRETLADLEQLLVPVLAEGERQQDPPEIEAIRRRRDADLERLDPGVKRLVNPHIYHVSLSQKLWELKQDLVAKARD